MTKAKAAEVMEVLVNADFTATYDKLGDNDYKITVVDQNGVLANTLKAFQDNNGIIARVRVIDLT